MLNKISKISKLSKLSKEFQQNKPKQQAVQNPFEWMAKIKILVKKQIDLSNLGADSQQLKMLKKYSKAFEQNKPKQQAVQNPFEWMTKIKILDLSKNALTDIRILSQICPNLQRLNISDNEIKELSFQSQFVSLRQIKAQDNFISKVSNFQKFKSIQNLNLSQNRIAQFKPDYDCPKLKEIDLSDNKIDKQFDFRDFGSLKILNLQDNVIGIFEYSKYPHRLQILNLEDNQIVQVNKIQYLEYLQILNLQKNQITKFEILEYQSSLRCIKLSQNPIKTLSLKGAEHLKQVYLDKTNLTDQQLTSNIQNLSKLQVLSIKSNMLTKIPDFSEFLKKKTLKKISLANNPILYGIDNKYAKKIPQLYSEEKMFELVQKVFAQKVQKVLQKINPILQEENKKFQLAKQKEQEIKYIDQEVNKLFEDAKQQEDKANRHQEEAAKLQQQETKIYAQGIQADQEVSLLPSEVKMEGNATQLKNEDATKEENTIKLQVKECKQENNEQKLGQEEAKKMQEQQKKRDKQQIQRLKEKLKKYQTKQQLRAKAAQFQQKAKKIIQNAGKIQEKTRILQIEVEKLQEEGNKIQEDRKKQQARIKQEQRKQAQIFEIVTQTLEEIVKKVQFQEEKIKRKQKFEEDAKHIDQLLQGNIEFCLPVEESYLFDKETYYFEQLSEMNQKFMKNSLRYQFFVWNSDYKKDKKRQNYYEKKPQTRKTDFIESTKQTSKKQRQLQVSYSGNQIYMKKITKQWPPNDYRESSSQAGYYRLLQRKSVMDFNVFFMFDWSKLIFVDFFDCSIDDTQWRLFVDNVESKLPHLVEIEIERNNIKTVKASDLQKFKNLKGIRFCDSYYDNPLSPDSISEIKIYRQNNPNCRVGIWYD